ncbi:MAG: TetR/AcrR family transcriptional regulator [Acholeplasmataceae bacterium]|nr:MAG: TetR/AcrR family transcriptional regulator [Acholeplasmataceae bacterium]
MQTTKLKILDAAVAFLKEQASYEQITLSKIAYAADIGKSTVYEHFASKEALIEETFMHLLRQYEETVFQPLGTNVFKEAFNIQIRRLLTIMKDAKNITNAIFNHPQEAMPAVNSMCMQTSMKAFQERVNERFKDIFLLGINEGIVHIKDERPYRRHVLAAIVSGLLYQYVNQEMDITENALVDLIETQCLLIINAP